MTYEQLTVDSTAGGVAMAVATRVVGGAQLQRFECRVETAQIRYRSDGLGPTTTVGTPLEVGDVITILSQEDAARIRFIRTGGTSGVLNIEGFAQ